MISERIEKTLFDSVIKGDVLMLAGTQSVFVADEVDETLKQRLIEKDVDITAPMWGAGDLMTIEEAAELENSVTSKYPEICVGLPRFGLKQERRKIRLSLNNPKVEINDDTAILSFELPAGSFATTVFRELLDYTDMTERAVPTTTE